MNSAKEYFGARIKEIREKRGLNQEELAELIDVEARHISRIETGKSFTTIENIEKIAKALNVNIETLFDFKHKQKRNVLLKEINDYLKKSDDKTLELVHRLILSLFL